MRKVTQQAVEAFMQGKRFKSGNTQVIPDNKSTALLLHGNQIAVLII